MAAGLRNVVRRPVKTHHLREASYALPAAVLLALLFALPLFGIFYQSLLRSSSTGLPTSSAGLSLAAYVRIFTTHRYRNHHRRGC